MAVCNSLSLLVLYDNSVPKFSSNPSQTRAKLLMKLKAIASTPTNGVDLVNPDIPNHNLNPVFVIFPRNQHKINFKPNTNRSPARTQT